MIKIADPEITSEDIFAVSDILRKGQLSGRSPVCKQFEDAYSEKFSVAQSIAVNSGTSALFLIMKAMGIGKGDEVIVPAYAFMAVANAVSHTGATPVFAEVDNKTFNINPEEVKRKITSTTKAIIAVHTYGLPCDMEALLALGVPVIEDAAEAHGAYYFNRPVGSIGIAGAFSFFANKTITTGEGGMVTTSDEKLANEVRKLKDQYNGEVRYKHEKIGFGMSLGAMQCALGLSQLKRLDSLVERKKKMAFYYTSKLKDLVEVPNETLGTIHSFWMYAIKAPKSLYDYLSVNDIEVRPAFYPMHLQPPYKSRERFYVTEKIYEDSFCLPMDIKMSRKDQDKVINTIVNFFD